MNCFRSFARIEWQDHHLCNLIFSERIINR
jgi:hypothetical protein